MKKLIYILILILQIVCNPLYSQIGIHTDTPDRSTVLEINSSPASIQGLLIPRMSTVQKNAVTSPAHSLLVYDTDENCISQNLGSESSPQWTCLTLFNRSFFYMPSINIPTVTLGVSSIDLFALYKNQFATPMFASVGSPAVIPQFATATDLYYYVTYHDPSRITINGITANGVMNYTTIKKANYDDYINIVFVVK